jgi:HK97 family phage major capsid protein
MATPDAESVQRIENRAEQLRGQIESYLLECRANTGDELDPTQSAKYRGMTKDLRGLERRVAHEKSELARCGSYPAGLQSVVNRGSRMHPRAASLLSPISFGEEQLRAAHDKARRGEAVSLEMRAPGFSSADSLLPPQLFEIPTFPRHEARLLDRLPGYALGSPSLEYVQVNSVTGAAGIVGEGQPKPEVTMPATKLICTALKLAVHGGISWENVLDFEAFSTAVRTELMRQVIDLENAQLWGGDPTAGGLNSLTKTAGILTFTATGSGTNSEHWTDLAGAISALRTGPSLAVPDLCLFNPATWAALRTEQDQMGRFYVSADPSQDQADQVWGVPVMQSTAFAAGEAVMVDTSLVGRVAVREALTVRIGYSGTDFVENILRTIVEERLNFAVERPSAIIHITGLPASAPTATATKTTTRK